MLGFLHKKAKMRQMLGHLNQRVPYANKIFGSNGMVMERKVGKGEISV